MNYKHTLTLLLPVLLMLSGCTQPIASQLSPVSRVSIAPVGEDMQAEMESVLIGLEATPPDAKTTVKK